MEPLQSHRCGLHWERSPNLLLFDFSIWCWSKLAKVVERFDKWCVIGTVTTRIKGKRRSSGNHQALTWIGAWVLSMLSAKSRWVWCEWIQRWQKGFSCSWLEDFWAFEDANFRNFNTARPHEGPLLQTWKRAAPQCTQFHCHLDLFVRSGRNSEETLIVF